MGAAISRFSWKDFLIGHHIASACMKIATNSLAGIWKNTLVTNSPIGDFHSEICGLIRICIAAPFSISG
jgi:hypothetical protein